ncbi:MAG: small arf-related GTPase ARFRP1 [Monoraphidium minutum]|nr:MAG: small arf-related GTPase ARFRP1 [Monoraphidium minutum]
MFSLIYGLVEFALRKEEFHVLVLGLDKAGKTNAVERLKTQLTDLVGLDPARIVPTVGLNVARFEAFGTNLVIWDLGGAPGLRAIWDKYFADSHAVIFVVDAAAPERWDEAAAAFERVAASRELGGAPVLVLANKQDAGGAAGMAEVAERFGLTGAAAGAPRRGAPCIVQPSSAHTGQGLNDGMKWLIEAVKKSPRRRLVPQNT